MRDVEPVYMQEARAHGEYRLRSVSERDRDRGLYATLRYGTLRYDAAETRRDAKYRTPSTPASSDC